MKVRGTTRINIPVFKTGNQNLSSSFNNRASWFHSAVASVGFGLAMFAPGFESKVNAQEMLSEKQVNEYKEYQAKKLNELLALPDSRANEIVSGLSQLSTYYENNSGGHYHEYGSGVNDQYSPVIQAASPQLRLVFKKGIDLLVSNDPQKQKIGAGIISRMSYIFPSHWLQASMGEIVGAKETMAPFFNDFLEKKSISDDLVFDSGLALLGFSSGHEAYSSSFVNWLSRHIDEESKSDFKEQRYKTIDTAVRKLMSHSYYAFPNDVQQKTKIAEPLLISYTNLVEKNGNNPEILKTAIDLTPKFKDLYSGYSNSVHKTYETNLLNLLDATFRNIGKSSESEIREQLIHSSLHLPSYFKDSKNKINDLLINIISKNLLSEDSKNKNKILYSLYEKINWNKTVDGTPGTKWSPYANLKLVEQNPEFFSSAVTEVLNDHKNKQIYTDKLIDIFIFFNDIPRMTKGYGAKIDEPPQELKEKVDVWLRDNVRKQIFTRLSDGFKNEKVKVSIAENGRERLFDTNNWNSLVNYFDKLTSLADSYNNDLFNVIKARLQEEKDIYNKEAAYGSLGLALDREGSGKFSPTATFIKHAIASENDHEAVRGIGKALGLAFNRQREAQRGFFIRQLNAHNENYSYLYNVEGDSKYYTETEYLLIDCVKILGGTFKAYLPDRKFEVTKEGKLKDPTDLDAVFRLRKNAFLVLAYATKECPDNAFKKEMIPILERKIEKSGKLDNFGEIWGHQIAALLDVYRSVGVTVEDNERFIKEKTDFLNKMFFHGRSVKYVIEGEERVYKIEPLFERLEESFARRLAQKKEKNWHSLSQEERKEFINSDEVKRAIRLTREKLSEIVFRVAPHNSVQEYRGCLREIGRGYCFSNSDLTMALDTVFRVAD